MYLAFTYVDNNSPTGVGNLHNPPDIAGFDKPATRISNPVYGLGISYSDKQRNPTLSPQRSISLVHVYTRIHANFYLSLSKSSFFCWWDSKMSFANKEIL